jgi:ABC-type nitrate/sulfonate/bicarbonate transport system substrate-binding protein
VDIAEFGMPAAIIAKSQGIDIKVVAVSVDVSNTDVLVSQGDQTINSPSDLRGKRVAAVRGSSDYFGLIQYLKEGGLELKDIQYLDVSAQNIVPAFRGKELDAAWTWSPWQNMLLGLGGKRVTSNSERGVLVPDFWVVRSEWAKNNPEALQKFLKANDAGLQQVRLDKGLAINQLAETLNVDQAIASQILGDAQYPDLATQYSASHPLSLVGGATGDGGLKAAMKRVSGFLLSAGVISAPANIDELLDPEPVGRYVRSR